ncbi:ANTAR domain-containing response regulator [Agaribacter marinus]|uniref:Two-component system response regulator n=1 Tax=Agaribacter marinus TaxID=1431249 RepID=A0AA37WIG1_9ALTE|nr:ANTAR domain-containing protein [Agaribacter marinus]GLR70983.1 two-component system response regulator [Agaribacter marinus]
MASNPAQFELSILLIDDNQARAESIQSALDNSRYCIKHITSPKFGLLKLVDEFQPDMIVIDIESPSRDMLESLHTISAFNPKPVVMFSEKEDTETINLSVKSGVSAYVAGDTDPARVRAILDAAVARFDAFQQLRQELDDTKQALEARKVIDQAKRLLMEQSGMSEQDAYKRMRKMAMDAGQKLEEVAKTLIAVMQNMKLG